MKKRIGNDIAFTWTVNRKNGELLVPESFEGKECMVRLIDDWGNAAVIDDVTFSTGQVTWLFKGKNQKRCSTFTAVLYENQGEDEMVTVDKVKAVTLVAHSYMEDDEECPCGTVEAESVEIESEISTGGSSTPIDAYTKAETDALLADKVDVLQIQGGYTASRYMSGTSFSDNSDQQGRMRSAAYEVGGITLVDLNGNIAHLQVNGVLQLNGKALATEDDTALLVDGGDYNSQSKEIELKHGNTVLARIDARAFVKDGMVDSVVIENGYIVVTFNTDAGKEAISLALTDIFNPANYYDKTAVDNLLANKVDKVSGKGLSTEDYTTAEKNKLGGLPSTLATVATSGSYNDLNNRPRKSTSETIYADDLESGTINIDAAGFAIQNIDILPLYVPITYDGHTYNKYLAVTQSEHRQITIKSACTISFLVNPITGEYNYSSYYISFNGTEIYHKSWYPSDTKPFVTTLELASAGTLEIYCHDGDFNILKIDCASIDYTFSDVAFSGSYNDLQDKPTIPDAQIQSDWNQSDNTKKDFIKNKPTIPDVTNKADKVNNATNGNFAALDSNGNLTDSGHKHSDYLTQHQDLTNYVQKSQTAGLLKNDGTVDTTQYLSQHQDISGKADKSEMSVVPGTGANADKTTITLKQGTSATVLTAHQDVSCKENVMPITTATGATLSAVVGNYYRISDVGTLVITLPTITGATKLQSITFLLITGSTPSVTFTSAGSETVKCQEDFATLIANTTYEVTALWNGSEWTLTMIVYQ